MILMSKPNMIGNEKRYMNEAFDSNWIAPVGDFIDRFEKNICKYVNAKRGVALSSGTASIHLAMIKSGVGIGDYVLCPDTTFSASINPAVYCGATPVFVDINKNTLNINKDCLYEAIHKYHPKVFVMVHMYGMPCDDIDEIMNICNENNIVVIEDATEALGSMYNGKHCGTFGKYGCYSFNGNKIITTSGGGMIVCDDDNNANDIKSLSTQAKLPVPYYLHEKIGYNYRLSNICAAIGVGQLENIEYFVEKKNRIHDVYKNEFKDMIYDCNSNSRSNYWLSIMKVSNAEKFVADMSENGIETRRIWTPLHRQPCYKNFEFVGGDDSDKAFETCVCMPSDPCMNENEIDYIMEVAKKYV